MTQKIGIIIIHGAGTPTEDFAAEMIVRITKGFRKRLSIDDAEQELVFEPIFWSSIFELEQRELWEKVREGTNLNYHWLRRFVIDFMGDAIAYQPTVLGNQNYDNVHSLVAESISKLRKRIGPDAPLCVISHSLGSVVAGNYFYDLQYNRENIGSKTKENYSHTPIEQCETLTLFYTLGSPIALWSLRYTDYGAPITVPARRIQEKYPAIQGEWLNFYDKDDVLAYPLKAINTAYKDAVTEDVPVNSGGLLTSWNPLSHNQYDTDDEVISRIVDGLVRTWKVIN